MNFVVEPLRLRTPSSHDNYHLPLFGQIKKTREKCAQRTDGALYPSLLPFDLPFHLFQSNVCSLAQELLLSSAMVQEIKLST